MSVSCRKPFLAVPAGALPIALVLAACGGSGVVTEPPAEPWTVERVADAGRAAAESAIAACRVVDCGFRLGPPAAVREAAFDPVTGTLTVELNRAAGETAWREDGVRALRQAVASRIAPDAPVEHITLRALDLPLEELVPNLYRSSLARDASRRPGTRPEPRPLVRRPDGPPPPGRGLHGRHVALWPSHGWYYERNLDRWEWQRARLFSTVEDVLPASFVLPFLAPMLERAGATVWLPRERDTQPRLVVADNDGSTGRSGYRETTGWTRGPGAGFATGTPPYGAGHNPFRQGTWRVADTTPGSQDSVSWMPEIEASGEYSVHVSYGDHPLATDQAEYTVRHAGGETRLSVDQTMAARTWVYVGTFRFLEGAGADSASVVLHARGSAGRVVSADAVRFGGGTGLVERGGRASGRPRWLEAARYHLQYSGMPDTLVYNVTGVLDDYGDDYRARGEWVNFLRGAPFGPNKDRGAAGLGVPVDLSLAFHTDAGVAGADTTIGTLLIYSSEGADSTRVFPDGMSRVANRDFADILQTQLVSDLRALHDSAWARRPLWDRDYSEAFRPNVPAALLELLSHQNFADMRHALDPAFRFDVARSIYKAMLRFLAAQYGEPDPVVQPLPPDHLEARVSDGVVNLRWRPVPDPLEPTALPDRYIVYTRIGEGGYDGGRVVDTTEARIVVEAGRDYGFRVAGLNDGGEGFPSEEVAAAWVPGRPRVLIVSGFDRVAPPAAVDRPPFRGFLDLLDHGVALGMDLSFTGAQHEFDTAVPWRDDDDPGHGASWGSHETMVFPGNTRDFPLMHGRSIRAAGYGYDTVSDERLAAEPVLVAGHAIVDFLLGEERETTPGHAPEPAFRAFPHSLMDALRGAAAAGVGLLVSGSYVGTELLADDSDPRTAFAREVLGIRPRTANAVSTGDVVPAGDGVVPDPGPFSFHSERNPGSYEAEAPDAVEPADDRGRTILRYGETNMSAAVAFRSDHVAVTLGFPFETIAGREARDRVMAALLEFLSHPVAQPADR
jgi:hypothetical protein